MTVESDAGPRLAVVICTYNRSASLCETLRSLHECGDPGESVDVLVVANRCADDTLSRLEAFRAAQQPGPLQLSWIEEPVAGKSHALNAAIAHTSHEALCFIDDDQVVESGFLSALLAGLREFPDDAVFCGRIWPAWDGSEPSWVHALPPYAIPIRPFPEYDLGLASRLVTEGDKVPSGGNITVRRAVFESVGGFAPDLGPAGHDLAGGEDHDFLQRARAAGCRFRYLPAVRQLHAIDAERTSTRYILRKSYLRSRSSFLVQPPCNGPRPYMLRKIAEFGLRSLLSWDNNRRFNAWVRLAASLGEFSASLALARRAGGSSRRLPTHRRP